MRTPRVNSSIAQLVLIVALSTLSGCARFPSTPPQTGKQLVVTLQVRGSVTPVGPDNRPHYYFIAIDNDGDPNTGPWAVAFPPYGGNGWVTSKDAVTSKGVTSFLEYDSANPGGYIYRMVPGSFLLQYDNPQVPIRYELLDNGSTIRFVIDFAQIAINQAQRDDPTLIEQLDINFITTNELAIDPNQLYPTRQFDGLGPSGQDYVNIDTRTDRLYSDDDSDAHGITDSDLDIVYWSVQVQTVSSR